MPLYEAILLAKWAILCLDGSFSYGSIKSFEKADGGAGPSAGSRLRGA